MNGIQAYCSIPPIAESVDLTTATDNVDRLTSISMVNGTLAHIDPSGSHKFLRFCVTAGLTKRQFVMPDGRTLYVHHSGIMMGEGLTGFVLNCFSNIVRLTVPHVYNHFPSLNSDRILDEGIDMFIENNVNDIQKFFDSVFITNNNYSAPSGDDLISFSTEKYSNAFRFLYRCFGFVPSTSTWYSSDRYALFTEECAIRTYDSNGWKFVDSVKPRVFSEPSNDRYGEVIHSKISLLTSYMKYVNDSRKRKLACEIADKAITKSPGWLRTIRRHALPVGLPSFFGGMDHPIGLENEYVINLPIDDLKILIGLKFTSNIDAVLLTMDTPSDSDSADFDAFIKAIINSIEDYKNLTSENNKLSFMDITIISPKGDRNYNAYRKDIQTFCRDNNVMTLKDYISKRVQGFTLRKRFFDRKSPVHVTDYRKSNFRHSKLKTMFSNIDININDNELIDISPSFIRNKVSCKADTILVYHHELDQVMGLGKLPSLNVSRM